MLPLKNISFDQYLVTAESDAGRIFPPTRFSARNKRIADLEDIYEGDFTNFVDADQKDLLTIPMMLSRRVVNAYAEIMLMSEPQAAIDLRAIAADAIRDMLTYGGSILLAYVDMMMGAGLRVINPGDWYPLEDGGAVIFEPFTSVNALTPQPDQVHITIIEDGLMTRYTHGWMGVGYTGQIGNLLAEEPLGAAEIVISPRQPTTGIWGESIFQDLAGKLLEITKRVSQNSGILDRNADPQLLYSMSSQDAIREYAGDDISDLTAEEVDNRILASLKKARAQDAFVQNDSTQKVEYLEFGGNLSASLAQINLIRELLANETGLPGVLDSLKSGPPSGRSLQLQFLPFFAATSSLQKDLVERLELALELLGIGGEVNWPHIFELLDDSTEEPTDAVRNEG